MTRIVSSKVPLSNRLTNEPGSPVPEIVGVLSLVMPPLFATSPVIVPTLSFTSVIAGTVGAMVSTMIFQLAALLVLFAASVAVTVKI